MAVVGQSIRYAVFRDIYTQLDAKIEIEAPKLGSVVFLNPVEPARVDGDEGSLLSANARQWCLWQAEAEATPVAAATPAQLRLRFGGEFRLPPDCR